MKELKLADITTNQKIIDLLDEHFVTFKIYLIDNDPNNLEIEITPIWDDWEGVMDSYTLPYKDGGISDKVFIDFIKRFTSDFEPGETFDRDFVSDFSYDRMELKDIEKDLYKMSDMFDKLAKNLKKQENLISNSEIEQSTLFGYEISHNENIKLDFETSYEINSKIIGKIADNIILSSDNLKDTDKRKVVDFIYTALKDYDDKNIFGQLILLLDDYSEALKNIEKKCSSQEYRKLLWDIACRDYETTKDQILEAMSGGYDPINELAYQAVYNMCGTFENMQIDLKDVTNDKQEQGSKKSHKQKK